MILTAYTTRFDVLAVRRTIRAEASDGVVFHPFLADRIQRTPTVMGMACTKNIEPMGDLEVPHVTLKAMKPYPFLRD